MNSLIVMPQNWESQKHSRFGGRFDKYKIERTGGKWAEKYGKHIKHWDIAPGEDYFKELFRMSDKVIIWGGNYFDLPLSRNFIVWRKLTIGEGFTMAMAEYAWTNIPGNAKVIECAPKDKERFHPTQKPVYLYKKLLEWYSKPGYKILDTHLGSGSSAIACIDMGFDFVGCEIDQDYYSAAMKRIEKHLGQKELFDVGELISEQLDKTLFDEEGHA
jgi:site-specific DNA-methyltransferase (adenine-specific)